MVSASDDIMPQLTTMLDVDRCSCVVYSGGVVNKYYGRGVSDMYRLYSQNALSGAIVADKVVGKGAAALMVLGGVRRLHAHVVSRPALDLLAAGGVGVTFDTVVANIINRSGSGICPVELMCADCAAPDQCLPLIREFVESMK